jgi:hypothetical protein
MAEADRYMLLPDGALPRGGPELAPAWREFIRFCAELKHGEIERLSIQDGLPVLAEITKKKVKFPGRTQRGAVT